MEEKGNRCSVFVESWMERACHRLPDGVCSAVKKSLTAEETESSCQSIGIFSGLY